MKQEHILKAARNAVKSSLAFTHAAIEQSKRLRTPSPKAAKIGTAIGACIGGGLLLAGTVQLLAGRPLWALGTFSAGSVTVLSNLLCHHRSKRKKQP